jgi:hypothetical protein
VEALSHWLQQNRSMTVQEWSSDTFGGSQYGVDELLRAASGCHYAVMVFWLSSRITVGEG